MPHKNTLNASFCLFSAEMFDKQQANSIFWSPQGQFLVLAGLRRSVEPLSVIRYPSSLVCVWMHNCLFSAQHEWSSCLR